MYKKDFLSIFNLREDLQASFYVLNNDLNFANEYLIDDLEGFLYDYHADLAPIIFKKAANEVIQMATKALKPFGEAINFLQEFDRKNFGEDDELNEEEDDYEDDDELN